MKAWPCSEDKVLPLRLCCYVAQGGPQLWSEQMDGLLSILGPKPPQWATGEAGDMAWALAHARHWTPRLTPLEAGLVQVQWLAVPQSLSLP